MCNITGMAIPALSAVAELLKPITWFPPMWAFGCGVVASGVATEGHWPIIIVGIVLAGPMVCASSQAVNDWFDRHVDAINEPQRPIPSGRMPGRWGLAIAILWTLLSLLVAAFLGPWGFGAAVVGLLLAWAYSAPPLRLKLNGWWGNAACGLCYEGLAWATGAAVMAGGSYGEGVLLKSGHVTDYYNSVSASWGWQAGAESYAYFVFLMSDKAVQYLAKSKGWEFGVGPTVVVVNEGVAKNLTTSTLKDDAYAYIADQQGLMASLSIEGTKISRIKR